MRRSSIRDEHAFRSGDRFELLRATTDDARGVVIKTVRRGRPSLLRTRCEEQLQHEHDVVSALEIPGVERPVTFELWAGRPALILEDAGPRDLTELLKQGPLDIATFLDLAEQMATVLGRVHAKNVIHRDVCPANFVLSDDGRVTLVDFGLATKTVGLAPPAGEPQGTLPYLAPEQTGRLRRGSDRRTDLYALGATFYEMLTGSPPFTGSEPAEIIHAHLARVPVPPAIVNPSVPRALSDIVVKLLAKAPEWRYQSADGLAADLAEATQRWRTTGSISAFELGRQDVARQLPLPRRLYGRERESAALGELLSRVAAGRRGVAIVSGRAGVGKTVFVESMRDAVEERGRFFSGKCDVLHAGVPFAPVLEALRGALRGVLSEPREEIDRWKARFEDALGANARVLTEVLPELSSLIADPAPLVQLPPMESTNRFHFVVSKFIRAFTEGGGSVLLFLDDVQWLDEASLGLVKFLAADTSNARVLVVLAYRDRDVGPTHPVATAIGALGLTDSSVVRFELGPLDHEAITALLSDALRMPPERVVPLAAAILDKTRGSPLFVVRFLRYLQASRLLVYDTTDGTWSWDLCQITELPVSENVVELLIDDIRALPPRGRRALEIAACIGARVELDLLAQIGGWSVDDTAEALWVPIQEGFLLPLWADRSAYRFAHDRVQQAAYSLLSDEVRRALHHRIGTELAREKGDTRLFEIADQLNLGTPPGDTLGVETTQEWRRLASFNLRAGQKAKAQAAHEPALRYIRRGLDVLPDDGWFRAHDVWFSLHREGAECAYICGDHALGDALVERALPNASPIEKADLCDVRVLAYTMKGVFDEALRWGRIGLRALGADMPDPSTADFETERRAVEAKLAARTFSDLLELPTMTDGTKLAEMKLLSGLGVAAWFSGNSSLLFLLTMRRVTFVLDHGTSEHAPTGFTAYALLRAHLGDYAGAEELSRLAMELARRSPSAGARVRPELYHAFFIHHWRAPLHTTLPLLARAGELALESGDFAGKAFALGFEAVTNFSLGAPLDRVLESADAAISFCDRGGHKALAQYGVSYRQAARALMGLTRGAHFDDIEFDEETFSKALSNNPTGTFLYAALRLQVAYLLRDLDEVERMIRMGSRFLSVRLGFIAEADYRFYAALGLAALCDRPTADRARHLVEMKSHAKKLAQWTENCPENFRHKYLMVRGEIARIEGHDVAALRDLDTAIEDAHRAGFPQDEALAYELAARYYVGREATRLAGLCVGKALERYAAWGASAKVISLEREMIAHRVDFGERRGLRTHGEEISLDLKGLLKATETLSAEVVFDRLLEKLLQTCIETAGAERAVLVVEEGDVPVVRATGRATGELSLEYVPLAEATNVPRSTIQYVRASGEVVVLADAAKAGRFVSDPDIESRSVRSILAVPLARQGQHVGVLYLENNLAPDVFGPDRVQVFELLATQLTIALENSRLFTKLEAEIAQRTDAEAKVGFLANAGAALVETLAYEPTLARVAKLAVPFLADWCLVDLAENGKIRRAAGAHEDPDKQPLLDRLREKYSPDWDSPQPSAVALRTGEPQFHPETSAMMIRGMCRDLDHAAIGEAIGARSVMALPLIVHGRTIGALTFGRGGASPPYTEHDLAVAKELVRRAALAIDNARLYSEVEEAVRLRDEFLSVASHELRTPITSLRLSTEALLSGIIPASPENVKRTLKNAHQQILRLTQLIDALLSVSHAPLDSVTRNLEDVDLRALVGDVVSGFTDLAARAGCTVTFAGGPPVVGIWDRGKLEQVVTNLLSNAVKFGHGKGIEIELTSDGKKARLVVTDHGIGIARERIGHIFDRYARAVSVRHYGGLGLGLYIVRGIVEAFGGTVLVESTLGEGATFTVELPLGGPPRAA